MLPSKSPNPLTLPNSATTLGPILKFLSIILFKPPQIPWVPTRDVWDLGELPYHSKEPQTGNFALSSFSLIIERIDSYYFY